MLVKEKKPDEATPAKNYDLALRSEHPHISAWAIRLHAAVQSISQASARHAGRPPCRETLQRPLSLLNQAPQARGAKGQKTQIPAASYKYPGMCFCTVNLG